MEQSEEEKRKKIASYLHEQIPESDDDIKPIAESIRRLCLDRQDTEAAVSFGNLSSLD